MQETWVLSLGQEDPLEKGMVIHSSVLPSDKEPACQCSRCRRWELDRWVGKISWRREWQPNQYSCLENPMDRGAWRATVCGVAKSRTWLSMCVHVHTHAHTHTHTHMHTDTPVLLPAKFHGQRSLAGYDPWCRKESDMTGGLPNKQTKSYLFSWWMLSIGWT